MKLHSIRPTSALGRVLGMVLTLGAAAMVMSAPAAHAHHGVSLAAAGDVVRVTILPKDAAYTHEIWLKQPGTNWLYLGRSDQVGRVRTIRVLRHRELQFAIRVLDTDELFFIGPRSRNDDGLVHAEVYRDGPAYIVGWEDVYGHNDEDYNDARFRVEGAYLYSP